jgi:LysR family nitrogen assimilation transcriptional regulator
VFCKSNFALAVMPVEYNRNGITRSGRQGDTMDFRQLRSFQTIVELGSFNRAAARLHVAQPALSRQIAMLEREIGVPLLIRRADGSHPTLAGEVLAARASAILRGVEDARRETARMGLGSLEMIRLGIPPSLAVAFPMNFVPAMQEAFPKISLFVREAWTGHLVDLLVDRKLDYAVISRCQLQPGMSALDLISESLCLVSRHARCAGTVTWDRLANTPLVLPPPPHGTRLIVDAAFRRAGQLPRIAQETEVLKVMTDIVLSGAASAILSRRDAMNQLEYGGYIAQRITRPELRNVWVLVWRDNAGLHHIETFVDNLAQRLRGALRGSQHQAYE